jgi:hypothetical protein
MPRSAFLFSWDTWDTYASGVMWPFDHLWPRAPRPNANVEALKDALLTLALMVLHRDRLDDYDPDYDANAAAGRLHLPRARIADYAAYDGSILPSMAGTDLAHACFSYLADSSRGPCYSVYMDNKQRAVVRYLDRNISTPEQAEGFFDAFAAILLMRPEPDGDHTTTPTTSPMPAEGNRPQQ